MSNHRKSSINCHNKIFFFNQREQTLSEPLLRDITNADRGAWGCFSSHLFPDRRPEITLSGEMVWATAWTTTSEARRSNWATCQKEGLRRWTWPGSSFFHVWNNSHLNPIFLFSLNLVTVWRTTSGMGSLPKWKGRAQRKVRRGNDKTALHLPSVTPCSGAGW